MCELISFDRTCWDGVVYSSWFDFMAILGWGQLVSLKEIHPSVIRCCSIYVIHLGLLHECAGVMWFGKWFKIFNFEYSLSQCTVCHYSFWGHIIESIGHQMHVAYKDFCSYCSHHPIECSQPAFTKGQVALIESTCFLSLLQLSSYAYLRVLFFLFFGVGG